MSLSTAPTPCPARSRRAREYRDESPVYPTNRTGEGAMYRCVNDLYDQTGDIDIEYESVEDFLDILAEAVDEAVAAWASAPAESPEHSAAGRGGGGRRAARPRPTPP